MQQLCLDFACNRNPICMVSLVAVALQNYRKAGGLKVCKDCCLTTDARQKFTDAKWTKPYLIAFISVSQSSTMKALGCQEALAALHLSCNACIQIARSSAVARLHKAKAPGMPLNQSSKTSAVNNWNCISTYLSRLRQGASCAMKFDSQSQSRYVQQLQLRTDVLLKHAKLDER